MIIQNYCQRGYPRGLASNSEPEGMIKEIKFIHLLRGQIVSEIVAQLCLQNRGTQRRFSGK